MDQSIVFQFFGGVSQDGFCPLASVCWRRESGLKNGGT